MSEWKETFEDGSRWWVHDTHGNVLEFEDGSYIGMLPMIVKLGPFETPEQAQEALINNRTSLSEVLLNFNQHLVALSKNVKVD